MTITETQLHRYSRQVVMPEIDEDGQQALLSSRVTILGAGGLGSPVIANLAAKYKPRVYSELISESD